MTKSFHFKVAPGVITPGLLDTLRREFRLEWGGIHGVAHWSRVRVNGLRLALMTGADLKVVEYFAFLHDVCRWNEEHDPAHGARAGAFAALIRERHVHLDDGQFGTLVAAMSGHTHGRDPENITIATCWDADRLDLARVGIAPDPKRLCTETGRNAEFIHRASENARSWLKRYLDRTTTVRYLA